MGFKYLSFTGQSGCYAELPLSVLPGATTFTIEIKLATTSTKTSSNYWQNGHICAREIGGNWKDDFGLYINGGQLCFWAEPVSGGSAATSRTTSNAIINDGAVHKVAVVSSNGAIDLYCDGALVAHTDNVNAKITASKTILLAYNSDSASYLQMDLHEARFWNVARTQEQIFADIDGSETGLQAWYLPGQGTLNDYSGNNRHATLYGNPAYHEADSIDVTLVADVQRKVKNDAKLAECLKVYLPFNDGATEDLCGNTWTAYGNPTISETNAINGKALQLNGSSQYLLSERELGGQDFVVSCYENKTGGGRDGAVFVLYYDESHFMTLNNSGCWFINYSGTNTMPTGLNYVEFNYVHSEQKIYYFVNGLLVNVRSTDIFAQRRIYKIALGCGLWSRGVNDSANYWAGTIDEFQIYDGIALHTKNFTPPTAEDYFEQRLALTGSANISLTFDVARRVSKRVEFSVDVARIISNSRFIVVKQSFDVARKIVKTVNFSVDVVRIVQKTWRYVNAGDADDLIVPSTIIRSFSKYITRTGVVFYQTAREKCFDLPATPEIWLKFDVYFDGSNRWRAYNGGSNGTTGITAQTSRDLSFFSNDKNVQQPAGICKTNQLQTVLLHMVSGSSAGVVEAWVDGTKIYTYTGNVNQGADFVDIYLQSDGAGTYFSNVIISNAQIGLTENCYRFSVDVARRLKNRVRVSFAVARHLIVPFRVPFIGEHFNHLFTSFNIFRGKRQKINLPKKSKAYVRCTGTGVIRVFSDTNPDGVATGTDFSTQGCMYAELDACNSVSIELSPKATPLQVIKKFATCPETGTTSGTYLDKAINYASNGKFATKDALVAQFFDDLNNADSYVSFLREKCGVILGNDDTGAIIGVDASDTVIKTAQSIVPEPIPVKDWVTPAQGSTTTIEGLDIYFPTTGANGALNGTEKHILAGLNSVWIEQALKLIYNSLGLHASTLSWNDCYVIFVNDSETPFTAYVAIKSTGSIVPNYYYELVINMAYYSDIDKTSEDGRLIPSSPNYHAAGYLDRVIAHELTHVFTEALNHPLFIAEGLAELVHGIDDLREGDIVELLTTRKSDLADVFRTGGTTDNADPYAAGYLFLRYLAKQGQGYDNDVMSIPAEMTVTNLLISDGATDSEYNALTDNTRQSFSVDVSRTLIKHLGLTLDVAIRTVMRVKFSVDVARAILAELILFPIDSEEFLNGLRKSPARLKAKAPQLRAAKQNTQGLQSFEVTLSEQQITEQVKFKGIIPFDILQQVNGQYLDYHINMRVEKVQQEGIIYRCECCSDLDKLLFTQLAYKIPPSTWRKVGADDKTVEIQTYYPPATAHVQKIASALGLTPVMQFDNFLSTVLMDDLGGVTYNDLIRDVFGWSSRIPHQLINCYIRDGKLYVIQRGHEANIVDISNAKCTMPVITKELVRTTWGSTPWSKTQTTEFQHSSWQAGVPDDVTIGGGSSDTGGGSTLPSGDNQQEQFKEVSTQFSGHDYQGNTTYTYDKKGLLVQTYTHMEKDVPNSFASQITNTTVTHGYDDDNTMIYTETNVQSYGPDGDSSSRSIEEKGYVILPNGEKFLAWESSATYQNDSSISLSNSDLVDSRVTIHSPSRVGQSHTITIGTDGEIIGSAAGQNTGDDRVTPFSKYKTALLSKQLFKKSSGGNSGGSSGGGSGSDSGGSSGGEWTTDKETWELTTNGLSLYDSSFPIHDEATLIKVTNALKWLNRKTQETLIISVYEFPHLIDFNDRVVFNGKTYFLVNNTAATTPRIFNEQNLTLARWY